MNFFDSSVIHFLNGFSQKSFFFDRMMNFLVDNYFLKGAMVVAVFWYLWFRKSVNTNKVREGIVITIISSFIAIILGRLLALTLPFRVRPVYDPSVIFLKPYRFGAYDLGNWSSFPSDHAIMYFALATGIFLISKKLGILTYLYTFFVGCFPRMYMGLHYPSDVLVGAVIGVVIALSVSKAKIFFPLVKKILHFSVSRPGIFYALFFLLSYQISDMFEETRAIGEYFLEIFHKVI